jgi:ankyrin repeat protein
MSIEQDENLEVQLFEALREHSSARLGTLLGTLILAGVDINALRDSGRTALQAAFDWGCPDELRLALIDSGADVRSVLEQIGWAAGARAPRVLHLFLEAGADVDRPGADGRPLQLAARSGDLESVRLLLAAGADVDAGTGDGSPLGDAVERGHAPCALLLLRAGARPQHAPRSRPILGVAAHRGMTEVVAALLAAGAHPDPRISMSDGPYLATDFSAVFDSMFHDPAPEENAAPPGLRYDSATPLLVAAGEGHADIVRLLLEHGADVAATDASGRTAYDVAHQHHQLASVIALLDGGADPHAHRAAAPAPPIAPAAEPPADVTAPAAQGAIAEAVRAEVVAPEAVATRKARRRPAKKAAAKKTKTRKRKAVARKAGRKNAARKNAARKKAARKAPRRKTPRSRRAPAAKTRPKPAAKRSARKRASSARR